VRLLDKQWGGLSKRADPVTRNYTGNNGRLEYERYVKQIKYKAKKEIRRDGWTERIIRISCCNRVKYLIRDAQEQQKVSNLASSSLHPLAVRPYAWDMGTVRPSRTLRTLLFDAWYYIIGVSLLHG
jgi:hypothetical protein